MRVLIVMASAGFLLLPAGPVAAKSSPTLPVVQPSPASPGARVWVYDGKECTAHHGTATSQALTAPITLAPLANMTGGHGTLREGLAAGTYTITLHCGSTLTASVRVTGARHAAGVGTPTGGAGTGDGSAEAHLGVGDAAVGSAFLLSGLGLGIAAMVRRRRAGASG